MGLKKLAQVVIVGFPNVGKSTLFNRLLRARKSIVHSLPGMTRDAVSVLGTLGGKNFILTDTGGFFDSEKEPLTAKIKEKAWESAKKADFLIFVLDGKRDLLPIEEELFLSLKKLGKPLFVVVNKVDSDAQESGTGDFFRLGEERMFFISAEHKRNLGRLEEALADVLPEHPLGQADLQALRIAVIGRINVGKSSIINRLCGEERLIVSEIPGTTRDSTDTLIIRNKKIYTLVDTAGIRKMSRVNDDREKAGIVWSRKAIEQADVLCLILDAADFPTRQDLAVAHLARESGKPLVLAINKWDLITTKEEAAAMFRDTVDRKMEYVSYAPLLLVSALSGKGVIKILDEAERVYQNSRKRVETSRLNEFWERMKQDRPPQTRSKRPLKIRYLTQVSVQPPTFVLFANRADKLLPSYEKFLARLIQKEFDLWGMPVRLFMREG